MAIENCQQICSVVCAIFAILRNANENCASSQNETRTRTRRGQSRARAERAIQITDISCSGCIWHFSNRNIVAWTLSYARASEGVRPETELREKKIKKANSESLKGATIAAAISSFYCCCCYCCWQQLFTPLSHSWDARLLISHSGQELPLLLPIDCLSHTRAQRVCCNNNNKQSTTITTKYLYGILSAQLACRQTGAGCKRAVPTNWHSKGVGAAVAVAVDFGVAVAVASPLGMLFAFFGDCWHNNGADCGRGTWHLVPPGVYVIFDLQFLLRLAACNLQFALRVDWTVNRRRILCYNLTNFVHVCIYESDSRLPLTPLDPHSTPSACRICHLPFA